MTSERERLASVQVRGEARLPAGDYVSPGLSTVLPDACFPNMIVGDTAGIARPWFRRQVPHNWYCDRRKPLVGFLDRDEALLLHNLALPFRGKAALEIGCWMGWSTCHLALAGLALDVLDPVLAEPEHASSVGGSLADAGVLANVRLYGMSSPDGIRTLAEATKRRWSLFFIDGDHEAPAPERDTLECMRHAADDAMIVLHALASPDVAKGLDVLRCAGWNVLVYQTMQIVGVAWRGQVRPIAHAPDPAVVWSLPGHLAKYPVSGESSEQEERRPSLQLAAVDREAARHEEEIVRLEHDLSSQVVEASGLHGGLGARDAWLASLRDALVHRDATIRRLWEDKSRLERECTALRELARSRKDLADAAQRALAHGEPEINRLMSDLTQRSDDVSRLSANVVRLESAVRELHESTSWRVTAPMRAVKNAGLRLRADLSRPIAAVARFRVSRLGLKDDIALVSRSGLFDRQYYVTHAGDFQQRGLDPVVHYLTGGGEKRFDPHPLFSCSFYTEQNPGVVAVGKNPLVHYIRDGAAEGRDPHPLFDTSFYVKQRADLVGSSEVNPLAHYMATGAGEGIDPHPVFDTSFYCERNPDVVRSGENPLVHYLRVGALEGRDPHPLFDTSFYCERNPDVVRSGENPLVHYLRVGALEGRDPHPLFDTSFYCERNPDAVETGENPLVHYLRIGAAWDVDPHPLFDSSYYRRTNPHGLDRGVVPLLHYLSSGAAERRNPHPLFNTAFYCERNPDAVETGENPLVHYLRTGAACGADPHPLFDSFHYREGNAHRLDPGINPLLHYLSQGVVERRNPHPLFDTSFYLEQKPHVAALQLNPLVHFLAEGPTLAFDPLSPPHPVPEPTICIVTPEFVGPVKNGGIGSACYHFAHVLAKSGHPVTVLFTGDLSPCRQAHWRNVYARLGIKFLSLSDTPALTHHVYGSTWFLERSWRVFKYLERERYAVVHFQDMDANGFWSIRAKRLGPTFDQTTLTVMTHSCTRWIDEGMQQFRPEAIETAKLMWAEAYAIEHCDVLLSPTRYMLDWLSQHGTRVPEAVFLTPNAYTGRTENDRPRREIDSDHLVFFGRLETRKGLHVLGEALRVLRRNGVPLPRIVSFLGRHAAVNGQPATRYLDDLREDLAPIEFVVRNDLDHVGARDYIEQTRGLVVMPSLLDNCPLAVIECIENRLPFLAARTGGISDMVDSRALFEPTPEGLAERLEGRHSIDHDDMRHPYSAREAVNVWRDLHHEQGPLAVRDRQLPQSAKDSGQPVRVSVCIRFFEHHRYLATLVDAFAHQSHLDLEVVLVNDGSGLDASREFDRVAARTGDERFRFLTMENRCPGKARNTAAEAATGDLLLFFDADNLPKGSDFVAAAVQALHWSGADCLTFSYDTVSGDRLLPTRPDVISTYRPWGACLEAGFFENVLGDAAMILPRSVFTRVGGFPSKRTSWEAHEFLLRLCFRGFRLETFPEALFYHRLGPSDASRHPNPFPKYQSLFEQLQDAPSGDLARILKAVGGPMLVARFGVGSAHHPGGR